jgi:hypothetical protein
MNNYTDHTLQCTDVTVSSGQMLSHEEIAAIRCFYLTRRKDSGVYAALRRNIAIISLVCAGGIIGVAQVNKHDALICIAIHIAGALLLWYDKALYTRSVRACIEYAAQIEVRVNADDIESICADLS